METLRLYVSSAWTHLAENHLKIDPAKRVCTFRLKVLLTTLTVCGMLFGAAGFAVLGKACSNSRLPPDSGIINAEDLAKVVNASKVGPAIDKHKDGKMQENTEAPDGETTTALDYSITTDDGDDESPSTTPFLPWSTTNAPAHNENADRINSLSIDGHKNKKDPHKTSKKGLIKSMGNEMASTKSKGKLSLCCS